MPDSQKSSAKIVIAAVIIVATMAYLAFTGVRDNKSYYVTIGELQAMGNKAYVRHLRVAGNVAPGSIHRTGTFVDFALLEQNHTLKVSYKGVEPPPDTFKDDAQALAVGTYGHDGRLPRHAAPGQMRLKVRSGKTRRYHHRNRSSRRLQKINGEVSEACHSRRTAIRLENLRNLRSTSQHLRDL